MVRKGGILSSIVLLLFIYPGIGGHGGSLSDPDRSDDPCTPSRAEVLNPDYIVATSVEGSDPYYAVAQTLADHRGGAVVTFDITDLPALMKDLNESGARYVAVVVRPGEMDINFNRAFIMNSTTLDEDPFPDFSWGYITGPTADEAMDFVENIIKAESEKVEDLPLDISGYSVSDFNARYQYTGSFSQYVVDDYIDLYLEANDTGAGRDFFLSHSSDLEGRKIIDISGNGDPHMTWLFEGGNFDPVPPVWDYDPAKIEDPANARMGITPENLSGVDLYPAVMFSGTCHSGVPKRALIEGDIAATFGDTGWTARFYNMSDDFSFFNRIIQNNVTGYFAPIGANHGYMSIYDQWNALRFNEPLGDIQKRSMDQVVMGFMGNKPNLRLYTEGEYSGEDIFPSGSFDPDDWPSAAAMLGGKANRVYYGDPLFDPFRNDHDPRMNLTTVSYDYVNDTTMEVDISYHRPSPLDAWFPNWDMFHFGQDWFYEAVDLPLNYSDPLSITVVREDPSLQRFNVMEDFDGRSRLHVEADLESVGYLDETWYNITLRITREGAPVPFYNLSITPEKVEGHALPGENATYDITVKNGGNIPVFVSVFHNDLPGDWSMEIEFNGSDMGPHDQRNATITVGTPENALFGSTATLWLTFISHGFELMEHIVNITTRVDQVFGVDLLGVNGSIPVKQLETNSYPIEVRNTGNGLDRFEVNASKAEGWNITVHFPRSLIDSGSIGIASVNITPPITADAYDNVSIVMTAKSLGDPSRADLINITFIVERIFGVLIDPPANESVLPGSVLNMTARIKNRGNGPEDIIIGIRSDINWTISGPSALKMEAWAEKEIKFQVHVPDRVLVSTMAIFTIDVASVLYSSVQERVNFTLTVGRTYELSLASDTSSLELGHDQKDTIQLTVTNLGNGPNIMSISLSGVKGNNYHSLSMNDINIGPYSTENVTLTINGRNIDPGEYNLSVKATDGESNVTIIIHLTVLEDDERIHLDPSLWPLIILAIIAAFTIVLIILALRGRRKGKNIWDPE
jgi:uncharacterized membrane protein